MKFFFLVGAPRSGTTMLQQALNRHSRIAIPPETAFFTMLQLRRSRQAQHLQRINTDLGINLELPLEPLQRQDAARRFFEQMARLYLQKIDRREVTHFGEKTPEHQRRLPRIRRLFPQAKIILIYRDGRDVALSLTKLSWMSSDLYVNFALWLHYYRIQRQALQSAMPNLYCVQYERLAKEPESALRKLLDFLELPYEDPVVEGFGNREGIPDWEQAWKSGALAKISDQRVGVWQHELTAPQISTLECWGGAALQELGYPLQTSGQERLPWLFLPKVYGKALLWLMRRPPFDLAKPVAGVRTATTLAQQ